jgi:hypothetical protein
MRCERRILIGDAHQRLKELPDKSAHSIATWPPYRGFGRRKKRMAARRSAAGFLKAERLIFDQARSLGSGRGLAFRKTAAHFFRIKR